MIKFILLIYFKKIVLEFVKFTPTFIKPFISILCTLLFIDKIISFLVHIRKFVFIFMQNNNNDFIK